MWEGGIQNELQFQSFMGLNGSDPQVNGEKQDTSWKYSNKNRATQVYGNTGHLYIVAGELNVEDKSRKVI